LNSKVAADDAIMINNEIRIRLTISFLSLFFLLFNSVTLASFLLY